MILMRGCMTSLIIIFGILFGVIWLEIKHITKNDSPPDE